MLSKWLLAIGAFSTMGLLSAIFSGSNATAGNSIPGKVMADVYRVDLSGNQLTFQIPDNYSRDLLTDPVISSVDIFSLAATETSQVITQRWWDFDKKKFFGKKNLGHLQVTLRVVRKPLASTTDFFLRDQLILYIHNNLIEEYREQAEKAWREGGIDSMTSIPSQKDQYRTIEVHNNYWLQYFITGPEITNVNVLPISSGSYIELAFTRKMSPSLSAADRYEFFTPVDEFEARFLSKIQMSYAEGTPIKQLTGSSVDYKIPDSLELEPLIRPEQEKIGPHD